MAAVIRAAWLLVCLLALPAIAAERPDSTVRKIYEFYEGIESVGLWPTEPEVRGLFSDRLIALLDADDARARQGGLGRLDFDPFVDGQDFNLSNLVIERARPRDGVSIVNVRFENFGEPKSLVYILIDENGSWRIDDVESQNGPYPWRLGAILTAD